MAIVTRLLSCTLLALLLLHGHLVQVRADQQQQPSGTPQSATHWQQSSTAQPTPSYSSNGKYGNDNKPGDVGTSSWQPNDKQPGYPNYPGQGPPPPGPPPPMSRPYPGHGPDNHQGDNQYSDKPQVFWGQCGGYYYKGPTKCADGSYCRYFSDWYSQCNPNDHHH